MRSVPSAATWRIVVEGPQECSTEYAKTCQREIAAQADPNERGIRLVMAKILNDPESALDLALSHPSTYAVATMRLQKLELSNTRTFALAKGRY